MQRSNRLIITAIVAVVLLYKIFTYNSSSDFVSSWSKAHPPSQKDAHKEVIAGDQKVHDKVSEHKVAEHALDALPGGFKGQTSSGQSSSTPMLNALANAT